MKRWQAWLYGVALRAYPPDVRDRIGAEIRSSWAAMVERASPGIVRAWVVLRGLADAVLTGVRFRRRPWLGRALLAGTDERGATGLGRHDGASQGRITMSSLISDFRYAVRTLARQPLFAVMAVLTLALGIGANTAVFSVVYGLLGRPFPYPERVTPNVFDLFGVAPVLGRGFTDADNQPGAVAVAVLSWGFWQQRFGGDRSIVGQAIHLDGESFTVIGVMPREFVYPDDRPDLYVPFRANPAEASRSNYHNAIGRLAAGMTVEQASREVGAVAEALAREYPDTNRDWSAYVVSLRSDLVGEVGRQAAFVLSGAVGFVLLMACVNVANLLLARANSRGVRWRCAPRWVLAAVESFANCWRRVLCWRWQGARWAWALQWPVFVRLRLPCHRI